WRDGHEQRRCERCKSRSRIPARRVHGRTHDGDGQDGRPASELWASTGLDRLYAGHDEFRPCAPARSVRPDHGADSSRAADEHAGHAPSPNVRGREFMNKKVIALFLVLSSLALAQTVSQNAPMPQDHTSYQGMPGMQHNMPGMPQMENPAQTTGSQTPAADLLKDVVGRPAMHLEEFQQFALSTNPTLRQATALVRQSSAQ